MSDHQNLEAGRKHDRVYGEHVGIVEDTADPKKLLRVRVRVFGVFTDKVPVDDLPWAEYKLPVGASLKRGTFTPVQKGDYVWVAFPFDGDTRRPIITGGVHHAPGSVPNLPHEVFVGPDAYKHKRVSGEPKPANHVYHEDEVSTLHGVTIERNKNGSYSVYQRSSGTELTITKEGHMILHVEGDVYRSASGNSIVKITGDETETISGHQKTTAEQGIDHDGGSGSVKGVVTQACLCSFTGKPHADVSTNVKASK